MTWSPAWIDDRGVEVRWKDAVCLGAGCSVGRAVRQVVWEVPGSVALPLISPPTPELKDMTVRRSGLTPGFEPQWRWSPADVRRRPADELQDLNRIPEALAEFDVALATFEHIGDTTGQALMHRSTGRLHQGRYEMVAGISHLDAAVRLWPPERQDAELALLLLSAARARSTPDRPRRYAPRNSAGAAS